MRRLIAAAPRIGVLGLFVVGSLVSTMPSAHAAITVYYSTATVIAQATAWGSPPQEDRVDDSGFFVFSELVSATNAGSYEVCSYEGCDTISYSSASQANLAVGTGDLSGVFYASGGYSGGVNGEDPYAANAGGGAYTQITFDVDQPYAYSLQVSANAPALTGFTFQFGGDLQNPGDAVNYSNSSSSSYFLLQEGVLLPNVFPGGRNYIYAGIGGCQFNCSGSAQGAFDFTLTLTPMTTAPVPLPAAAWLLLSGLGGLGVLGRRRKAA